MKRHLCDDCFDKKKKSNMYHFPSKKGIEVEYMPLRSEIARAQHRKMVKDSILGFVFLVGAVVVFGVILWLV